MQVGPYYLHSETQASLLAESQRRREVLLARRAARDIFERRIAERRATGDRRSSDRRMATMDDRLAAEAARQSERRFSDAPISGFGGLFA